MNMVAFSSKMHQAPLETFQLSSHVYHYFCTNTSKTKTRLMFEKLKNVDACSRTNNF